MTNWLTTLVPHSLGDFEATPELDRRLSILALAGKSCPAARNELFRLLAAKIERWTRRYRRSSLAPLEYADVLSESYLAFAGTLRSWKPRYEQGQPAGYLYYFLSCYRLRLLNRVARLTGRWRFEPRLPRSVASVPDTDTMEADAIAAAIIDRVKTALGKEAGAFLQLKIATGQSVSEIAQSAGMSRRTAYRRWNRIAEFARQEWHVAA